MAPSSTLIRWVIKTKYKSVGRAHVFPAASPPLSHAPQASGIPYKHEIGSLAGSAL